MPKGKPQKGFKKSRWHMSEAMWHIRQLEDLLRKIRRKIGNNTKGGRRARSS